MYIYISSRCHRRPHSPTAPKKSTFINLLRDICAHNFRDPAIKLLRLQRELGVGSAISRSLYLLFDFVHVIHEILARPANGIASLLLPGFEISTPPVNFLQRSKQSSRFGKFDSERRFRTKHKVGARRKELVAVEFKI